MGFQPQRQASLAFSLLPLHAGAILLRNCDAARDPLACRLDAILNILYGAAFILAILLLGVVWAAVRLYRRNRSARATAIDEDE